MAWTRKNATPKKNKLKINQRKKKKRKTSLCCTFIHPPFQLSPDGQLEPWSDEKCYGGGNVWLVTAPEQPRELHTKSEGTSRVTGSGHHLFHLLMWLLTSINQWSVDYSALLGATRCCPFSVQYLPSRGTSRTACSHLTLNRPKRFPFVCATLREAIIFECKEKVGLPSKTKKKMFCTKNIWQRRKNCRGLLFSLLLTHAQFIWLRFAAMNHTNISHIPVSC